jgi:surfeit locus 1 family protein
MQDHSSHQRTLTITPAGVLATLALAVVIAGCVRLGFWQLDRLQQRRAINAAIAERMDGPPIDEAAALRDTASAIYRRPSARGTWDNERSIVLPGRSHRGAPGVHLLTPLRLAGGSAVLVNRGWVPSADAATVEIGAFAEHDTVAIAALVVPFPAGSESLAQRASAAATETAFRQVWYNIDERALRAQYPYPLLPVMLQALPAGRAAGYPTRLAPPALDEGPHFGYALQWFSFAVIGVIGWLALVLRGRSGRSAPPPASPTAIALVVLAAAPAIAGAQLRPLDPLDWRIYEPGTRAIVSAGGGSLWRQTAPLAGTRGRLLEIGNYSTLVRFDRVAIELAGTAIWRLTGEVPVEEHAPGVENVVAARQEAGPASAATVVNLTPRRSPVDVVIRFGTRLPTTSDESGLDRDRTDFFALAGSRVRFGALSISVENGIGIHGTTEADYPQSDVWTYAFGAEYDRGPLGAHVQLVGHRDGTDRRVRGNDDLSEARFGVRLGSRRWIGLTYIRGLTEFSPAHGLRITGGLRIGRDQPGNLGL